MEKLKISLPIIVEGRYDKSALMGFLDATVITTGGFSIFNNKEKQELIKRIGKNGIIILTDSDGGGKQIRRFLMGILPEGEIHNLYIPKVAGKESRKRKASKAGTLGVEGMEKETILRLLAPFTDGERVQQSKREITKADFFADGLTGRDNSSERRRRLCDECNLPDDMTPNALLEAMNLLYGYDEYRKIVDRLWQNQENN